MTVILKYWAPLSIVLVLALFAGAFLVPDWADAIAGVVLILSLGIAVLSVVHKQKRLYRGESAGKFKAARRILVELTGVLLAMGLAMLVARNVAEAATRQIGDDLTRSVVGIVTAMLIGLGVVVLVRRAWGRFIAIVS